MMVRNQQYVILVGIPLGKRPLEEPRMSWEHYVKKRVRQVMTMEMIQDRVLTLWVLLPQCQPTSLLREFRFNFQLTL
jgi:hypothetical protein